MIVKRNAYLSQNEQFYLPVYIAIHSTNSIFARYDIIVELLTNILVSTIHLLFWFANRVCWVCWYCDLLFKLIKMVSQE